MAKEGQLGSPDFRAYMFSSRNSRGYDRELQMFQDGTREPDLKSLNFLRWLAEEGRLEHGIESLPKGEYSDKYATPAGSARFRLQAQNPLQSGGAA